MEIRNKSEIQISNVSNTINCYTMSKESECRPNHGVLDFIFLSFEFVSYFVLGISDFES